MKTKIFLVIILALSSALCALSQVPQGINYQAVARDLNGDPITGATMQVRLGILSDTITPVTIWEELHPTVRTNAFGMFTAVLGTGVKQTGSALTFADIDWTKAPLYLRTWIYYPSSWKYLGTSKIWSVPYSMVAGGIDGALEKLEVVGDDVSSDEALFEVKRKDGETMFAVYNHGVRVYMPLDTLSKARKGGFAIGGFDRAKGIVQDYFVVNPDSIRAYIDANPAKANKGGFAIGSFDRAKADIQKYFTVSSDSVRIYIDDNLSKANKGGFAIGSFDRAKAGKSTFFDVSPNSSDIINPSQNRILWYPVKNAFLAGRVIIVHPDSVGTNSVATGYESRASGEYSQAFGYQSQAKGNYSTAIGRQAKAFSLNSFAFGQNARAANEETFAFGSNSQANGKGSVAIGFYSIANGWDAIAIGAGTQATGLGSFALGFIGRDSADVTTGGTLASSNYAVAVGMGAQSKNRGAFSIGLQTISEGYYSFALGYKTRSSGWYSLSAGYSTWAQGNFSTALGYNSLASGSHAIAAGQNAVASNWYSIAIGPNTIASGHNSIALGYLSSASGISSFAAGSNSRATGWYSVAVGFDNEASNYATALGYQSKATANYATSSGFRTYASGISSFAAGDNTRASGNQSSSFGTYTKATGDGSFASGMNTEASGIYSAAFGAQSSATGEYSFAAGYQTLAAGSKSFSMGIYSKAMSVGTIAIGGGTIARGDYSSSFGLQTVAKPYASMALGQYNDTTCSVNGQTSWVNTDPVFIIGNGDYPIRSNAFTILKNGNTAVGHSAPTEMLDVNGNGRFRNIGSGAYVGAVNRTSDGRLTIATSDISTKENIEPLHSSLESVLKMRGVSFTWKSEPGMGKRIGFIAQEVENIFPELVFTNPSDGLKGVNYAEMTAILVEAIKEQQTQIESEREENQLLRTELQTIREELEQIKVLLAGNR